LPRRSKRDQREIACGSAKVADQHQRIGPKALGIEIGRTDRLVDIGRLGDAAAAISLIIAM
jgi:hypothetical protein